METNSFFNISAVNGGYLVESGLHGSSYERTVFTDPVHLVAALKSQLGIPEDVYDEDNFFSPDPDPEPESAPEKSDHDRTLDEAYARIAAEIARDIDQQILNDIIREWNEQVQHDQEVKGYEIRAGIKGDKGVAGIQGVPGTPVFIFDVERDAVVNHDAMQDLQNQITYGHIDGDEVNALIREIVRAGLLEEQEYDLPRGNVNNWD